MVVTGNRMTTIEKMNEAMLICLEYPPFQNWADESFCRMSDFVDGHRNVPKEDFHLGTGAGEILELFIDDMHTVLTSIERINDV